MRHRCTISLLAAACAIVLLAPCAHAVEIDGRIDPQEWAGAQRIDDFRHTQPLSREPGRLPTQAWLMATERGLAVAFRNAQPAGVPRMRQHTQRDGDGTVDRVNLYVDFDGDGRTGYNFTVTLANSITDATVTNENRFNNDWDGHWLHATSEDEQGWSAEMLIPWHIAPMRGGADGTRTLGIQLDRVVASSGERLSWPAVHYTEARYLSAFNRVEVPAYRQSLLAITPYVVGIGDAVGHASDVDGGFDLFWKPSGAFQLSATVNPDFGQVESDELTVNFSATESFFSDKRPFFTENQGFFDVPFGSYNNSRLIYTRRVGGQADDGHGSGDVTAAIKLNGSAAGLNYGVFAASEGDAAGRDFYAARVTRDFERFGLGAMATRVERPFQDRTANVYEFDQRWAPNAQWSLRGTVVASDVQQRGRNRRDSGAQLRVDYDMGGGWRQQLYGLHLGRELMLNDFGYLERNNFNYLRYDLAKRTTALPADSAYAGQDWHFAVSRRYSDDGVRIADAVAVNRQSNMRDGGTEFVEASLWSGGHDDLLTRGHGVVRMPAKGFLSYERLRPRQGNSPWSLYTEAYYKADGLGDLEQGRATLYLEPSYQVSDRTLLFAGLEYNHDPAWLLWRGDNRIADFRADILSLNGGLQWFIDDRQELRVRLETIAVDARRRQVYRVDGAGRPLPVDEAVPDFSLRNLAFQVRYRYELAPLSYLYIAYVRGGEMFEEGARRRDVGSEFGDAFGLRDSEQLLVKLSYRFEI
ncbi:hypothetical protein SAMN04487939_10559 [Lysobacter sp. yr284]|uniref:DUF5916 domain-containing protein n=1 Tax=Lysobacter sp. yr284 TaxID=1761791 RepID=UPI0008970470|nr:DUF5916 domain-containing protein [Lysobacter sp. yr284]SDY69754.1 hypothetical protein SAMN04487939_10559 [Lysobacter sp. yr284]